MGLDTLSLDQWRRMGSPRVIDGAKPGLIPGEWLTPRETAPVAPHEIQVYVNGQVVERPTAVYLDATYAENTTEVVPPHVNAWLPITQATYVLHADGKLRPHCDFRPVDIYGEIEVRRCPPLDVLQAQYDALYVEEYGWSVDRNGRKLKPSRKKVQTMAEFMEQIGG